MNGNYPVYSMIDEIDLDSMTPAEAATIVDRLIAQRAVPELLTPIQREAVRIVWDEIEKQLAPINDALIMFASSLGNVAAQMIQYGRSIAAAAAAMGYEDKPAPTRHEYPGSRPAWQRNR